MLLEIPLPELQKLVAQQLFNLFSLKREEEPTLEVAVTEALQRAEFCFSFSKNKYYKKNGETYFSPFHSGQYAIFLYFLSHTIFTKCPHARTLADRVYYLNKALNSVELFYEVDLPKVFFADHPIGSVMGRASYSDCFSFAQNCTVGNNHGVFPVIGKNVKMAAGSTLLGGCKSGDNVILSANCYVKDADIPSNSIVFGVSPNLILKENNEESYFDTIGHL